MEDRMKMLAAFAGVGAALGAGVALGMGLRVLLWGAAFGLGVGAVVGLASGAERRLGRYSGETTLLAR